MNILYIKALHIIFVVTWFAGLFYIVRLFIYHSESGSKTEPERSILISHFKTAEKRLWYGITWPSLVLTWVFGLWLGFGLYGMEFPGWLMLKVAFVAGLTLYHIECHAIFRNLQKGTLKYSSFRLRIWNEVTTLFLFAIVFLVVLKDTGKWWWGLAGLFLLALLLLLGIYIYKSRREKN